MDGSNSKNIDELIDECLNERDEVCLEEGPDEAVSVLEELPSDDLEYKAALAKGATGGDLVACPKCKEVFLLSNAPLHLCALSKQEGEDEESKAQDDGEKESESPLRGSSPLEGEQAGKGRPEGKARDASYLDYHCGVLDEQTGGVCPRSLNCKSHSIVLKRAVEGRSESFDFLLKRNTEEKRKKKRIKLGLEAPGAEDRAQQCIDCRKCNEEYEQLESSVCSLILQHTPVIEKAFYIPEVKFDSLVIRSLFFQPLKLQRMQLEKKAQAKRGEGSGGALPLK